LQDNIILTARSGKEFVQVTHKHANALGVCVKAPPPFIDITIDLKHIGEHCFAANGYIFSGDKNKGTCLKEVFINLNLANQGYSIVVFIDDNLSNIQEMQEALTELNINFVGFHYTYMEKHLSARDVDLEIANIQYEFHRKTNILISKEQAAKILQHQILTSKL
jgi:hypothetical protein